MSMEVDHVFITVAPGGGRLRRELKRLGLRPSYSRRHTGQGTQNVCYAFDNLFLELLWEVDAAELESPPVARTRLAERVRRIRGACPLGVAVRGGLTGGTWDWQPTFLPPGTTLAVADLSEDPAMPLLFESPSAAPPLTWSDARAGDRQTHLGLHAARPRLRLPSEVAEDVAAALGGSCDVLVDDHPGVDLLLEDRMLSIVTEAPDQHRVVLT